MAKAKTSPKQKSFSIQEMPIVNLKNPEDAVEHDPTKRLQEQEFMFRAMMQAMAEGDAKAVKEILRAHYEAVNIEKTLKQVQLSKRTFYDAISPKGNPSLTTVVKMCKGMITIPMDPNSRVTISRLQPLVSKEVEPKKKKSKTTKKTRIAKAHHAHRSLQVGK